MPGSKNLQSGFTLVELLVSMMILAVGLLGLAQLQVVAIKANSQSATMSAATAISQKAIEEIRAWNSADPRLNADGTGNFASVTVAGAGTYSITWTVEALFEGVSNLCKVTIVVESTADVMGVLGNAKRTVTAHTLKLST